MSIAMKKITPKTAKDIAQRFELQEESHLLLTEEQTPGEFLQILMENSHYHDAVTFLAHALLPREAVWWACVCVRYHVEDADVKFQLGLKAAEAWVYEPTEENRRVAEKYAEEGNYTTPASWAAAAAFWSGGNINAIGEPAMEPPSDIYAHAVGGSIIMSAGLGMPAAKEVQERYNTYLKHGINIADGGNG